ncbi:MULTISPECIES: PLDc N-terminal domain-containing protein [Enterococcus]|uniref:Cardiolipin synthase N-terminal domain-containing protein n=1 Tax=Candidatus Enterococcus ferrettii TaxID=2815324 RepID=A0ABV0EW40_9ENTE|nr:PLDc N-terminal domain-containing protein [Enterococcus sp. 665A]MBO1342607.1 PLDc N-terminal domain-containing protein [Enterococcus sp. 665A]
MNNNWQFFMDNLALLLPLILLELVLTITALIHVLKHPHYRFGNRVLWIFIVVIIQIIGPVVYFAFGRGDEQ